MHKRKMIFVNRDWLLPAIIGLFLFAFVVVPVQANTGIETNLRLEVIRATDVQLYGEASILDTVTNTSFLQLTPSKPYVSGGAFYKESLTLSGNRSFSAYFTFQITDIGRAGADGFMFVVAGQPYDTMVNGGAMGYAGFRNSLAVEFDTFNNRAVYADPDDNHLAVNINGQITRPLATTPSNYLANRGIVLDDGRLRHVWIEYDGAGQRLFIRISNSSARPDRADLQVNRIDLPTILNDSRSFFGFTAATGESHAAHAIGKMYVYEGYYPNGVPLEPPAPVLAPPPPPPPPVNTKPVVIANKWLAQKGDTKITGTVTATDAEKDSLQLMISEPPQKGAIEWNRLTGTFTYTPFAGMTGVDSFKVMANDGKSNSDSVIQTLELPRPNHIPEIMPLQLKVLPGATTRNQLRGLDKDDDQLMYSLGDKPTKGIVRLNQKNGQLQYVANPDARGSDQFTVLAHDGSAYSSPVMVQVEFLLPPTVVFPANEETQAGQVLRRNFIFQSFGRELQQLRFMITTPAQNGIIQISEDGTYQYMPAKGFVGTDSFSFAISDGSQVSNIAEIVITVNPMKRIPYMYGYKDKLFRPNQGVTRGELAAAIVRTTGLTSTVRNAPSFRDVPGNVWMYRDIVAVHTQRIMMADANSLFRPSRAVTRSDMRIILQRLIQQNRIASQSLNAARKEIQWLAPQSVRTPISERFEVTRQEVVILFNRILGKQPGTSDSTARTVWTDVRPTHPYYADIMEAAE